MKVSIDFSENIEGRLICLEFPKFFFINVYVPNSKPDLSRLDYRVNTWEPAIRKYIKDLQKTKAVIYTGDFNVAPTALDIYSTKGKSRENGFTQEERDAYATLLSECKMKDAFRTLYPDKQGEYSWFSLRTKGRQRNQGWFIDRFVLSNKLMKHVNSVSVLKTVQGSDHLPVMCELLQ
jgi:exodeoxyribonuclease-3